MTTDPYHFEGEGHHVFWADGIVDAIERRDPGEPVVIKGGVSPSGIPHIGHFNEIMRGYYVAEVLRERGYEVRQLFTTDDRDPLRRVPQRLSTLDGEVVGLGDDRVDAGALGRNLGRPYTAIPDPFGCCESYGTHFTKLLKESADMVDVPVEVVSTTELYETGAFDAVTRHLLDRREQAAVVLSEYQDSVDDGYVPFTVLCDACGKLTGRVTDVDPKDDAVGYVCADIEAGGQSIDGCGHEAVATLRDGKLPWRFEWPAQWQVLGVDFEPFGKDHAEGSWPSGERIAREVLDITPPVPMVYEWFTVNGEALSSSAGTVVTVEEVLDLLEVEVFRYFFTKDPRKQRDFDIANLDRLVDEFDRFEALAFGESDGDDDERRRAERIYPFVVGTVRPDRVRIPYRFAAVLGMTDDRDLRMAMARRSGHLPDGVGDEAIERALGRIEKARAWAKRTDNAFNYRLVDDVPAVDFDGKTAAALDDLADRIEAGTDDVQSQIYETAQNNGVEPASLFVAGYRLFLDEPDGPRLGPFLEALETEFVVRRLRREA